MGQLVRKADKYEPSFTDAAIQWANHYGIFLSATRSRRPRDKNQIERLVNIVYTRIYAALRKKNFYNLNELRQAVKERLEVHNNMLLTGKDYSRREKFFKDEQPNLSPLPDKDFELQ
jgi:transposase